MTAQPMFQEIPADEALRLTWPTENNSLFCEPETFFARTRANPDYGKPGWTRDCGRRFHKGCDIAPARFDATGETIRVMFTDCRTETDFESEEPTFVPLDAIFAVFEGMVDEVCRDENASSFGHHVVLRHHWPGSGEPFYTLYGHLDEVLLDVPKVAAGQRLGTMGRTSRIADARNWMAIAPHLHFEVWNADRAPYDPVIFLQKFLWG